MLIDYRSISLNGIRRLGYLKYIAWFVKENDLVTYDLLKWALIKWSELYKDSYRFPTTGFIKSEHSAKRYIKVAQQLGLILINGSKIEPTKNTKLLYLIDECPKRTPDRFKILGKDLLFFTYLLFEKDADLTLQLLERFSDNAIGESVQSATAFFSQNYLSKINWKSKLASQQKVKEQLLVAKKRIQKFGISKDSIVSPRLHILQELNFLWKVKPTDQIYRLTEVGKNTIGNIPVLAAIDIGSSRDMLNIDKPWIRSSLFKTIAPLLAGSEYSYEKTFICWDDRTEHERHIVCESVLNQIFELFQSNKSVPKVRLDSTWLYFCITCTSDHRTPVDYNEFKAFIESRPLIGNYRYSIREGARSNEGYIVREKVSSPR